MPSSDTSIRHVDTGLLVTVGALIVMGLIAIYSATYVNEAQSVQIRFSKQLLWAGIGICAMIAVMAIPLRFFYKNAYILYFVSIALLVVTLFAGGGAGTKRWLAIGPVTIQAAEITKVLTLLALAKYLSNDNRNIDNIRELSLCFLLVLVPFLLIMKQPDLGSALVFIALILPMLHWAGLSSVILFVLLAPFIVLICAFNYYSFFFAILAISVVLFFMQRGVVFFLSNFIINIGVGIVTPIMWELLKDYQKNRILSFIGVVQDPHGLGYQVIQSKVAIGSGGFWGKGFLDGTQTHLRFLPEQHTDFIFCVIGEEFGFLGALIALGLLFYIVIRSFSIASLVKSRFSSLIAFGAGIIFLFQIFINVGMTIGIMPVTGLPLPFLSYGGSSLLSNLCLIGLLLSVSKRRFEYL